MQNKKNSGLPGGEIILQNRLRRTCDEFVGEVFGDFGVCPMNAARELSFGILRGGTTLLSGIARALAPEPLAPPKELRERLSEWLGRYDFLRPLGDWLADRHAKRLKDGEGVAFDVSDISKLYGGGGMEGMEMGYDGSAHEPHMGHLFAAATRVPNSNLVPMPLCVRMQRGKHGANELLKGVVKSVMEVSEKRPVGVVDRGGDDIALLNWFLDENYQMVVRIKELGRDVAGTGEDIPAALESRPWADVRLVRLSGAAQPAQVRFMVGQLPPAGRPRKGERTVYRRVLVVESRFDGKSLYFYRTLPETEFDDEAALARRARETAQLYLNRWQIEISFLRVKQDFGLEDARVRTFKRLENLLAPSYLCHVFTHFILPAHEAVRTIVKVVRDNFGEVCRSPNALLANVRELLRRRGLRHITGRPPRRAGPPSGGPVQTLLPLPAYCL